jgi:hypothetical protein
MGKTAPQTCVFAGEDVLKADVVFGFLVPGMAVPTG